MTRSLCFALLFPGMVASAQIVLPSAPSSAAPAPAPVAPASGVKMIEPTAQPAAAGNPADAKPQPLTTAPAKKPAPKTPPTVIDAENCTFDAKKGVHVFWDDVKVKSPQFDLVTDGTLEVTMKQKAKKKDDAPKTDEKKADAGAKPADPKAATAPKTDGAPKADEAKKDDKKSDAAAEDEEDNEIDHAIAHGKGVRLWKTGPDGKIKEAVGREVIYDSTAGTLTVKVWAQVQDGPNLIIATDPATIMILDQDNHLNVKGPHQTKLMPQNDPNKKGNGPPGRASGGAPAPAGKAAPAGGSKSASTKGGKR